MDADGVRQLPPFDIQQFCHPTKNSARLAGYPGYTCAA